VVVVVGGLVGGVVVGGTVVGGAVGGVGVVGEVVGEGDVAGVDLETDGTVVGDELELAPPALVPDGVVVGLVFVPVPAPPAEVALGAGLTAEDFPSDSTAYQSLSTPCPVASPFFVSLTKW
jgi:hypothetical protein